MPDKTPQHFPQRPFFIIAAQADNILQKIWLVFECHKTSLPTVYNRSFVISLNTNLPKVRHEPPALLVVCCWPYGADVTFPPKGGLTNHCLVTLPPKGGSVSHCLVTGGRLKAALCYLAYSPSIWSRSYCSLMYFLIVSSFTLPTVSQ